VGAQVQTRLSRRVLRVRKHWIRKVRVLRAFGEKRRQKSFEGQSGQGESRQNQDSGQGQGNELSKQNLDGNFLFIFQFLFRTAF